MERELEQLKSRQAELRQQLRQLRSGEGGIRKLEEKLSKQLAPAKWTASQIREIKPDWDEIGFYGSVQPRQPTPRGPRRRSAEEST